MSTPAGLSLPNDQDASGRTLGKEELAALSEVISSGTLTSTKGQFVKRLEREFAELMGVRHAFACASGTAAIHCAVAALDPEPGDEIITSPITDMGAITPIIYEGAIPVFADVDPISMNVTAETVERAMSNRTRAIIVTHLFGNPAEIDKIKALADAQGAVVIEDCAQSFLAVHDGAKLGTVGAIGCFSLQQGKHITTGEGGIVTTNCDHLARRMFLYINKAWGYGDPKPDHYFLALNYRMTELQGAVAVAQLPKLSDCVETRIELAAHLSRALSELPGLTLPKPSGNSSRHVYWKYPLIVDERHVKDGPVGLATALRELNIASAPRYIQKPAFQCAVIRDQRTFGRSRWPFTLARPEAIDYSPEKFTGTFEALSRVLVLPWNERYETRHVDYLAESITAKYQLLKQ
ncbi:MAG: DegT/DnrJ/EryC1/StrS family aminotransferase [Pseudomonadota bacterium]